MDAITRLVDQHVEYEIDWKPGFVFQSKLNRCTNAIIEWCSTDKQVLIETYSSVLNKFDQIFVYQPQQAVIRRNLIGHTALCCDYDVTKQSVSLHLPLTRLLVGLHLCFQRLNLHSDGFQYQNIYLSPVQIIEPVLRLQAMRAQVKIGMWRRNGRRVCGSLAAYRKPRYRTEMFDRDITALQIAACSLDANEFLIHILNKFNLIEWATPDFKMNNANYLEQDIKQFNRLVDEFLHLLIIIIGERYLPDVSNVTIEDNIRREIIQQLCIQPLPYSVLTEIIPEHLSTRQMTFDKIISEIAVLKTSIHNPGKSVYEHKDKLYDDFNMYFYHYTSEESSKAEESQRNRRKLYKEIDCCPPPRLPKLNKSFQGLVRTLQCKLMLHLMQIVLERYNDINVTHYYEPQLHKILYLIGYALLEEETNNYEFFHFTSYAKTFKLLPLLRNLLKCSRVDSCKGMLEWTIAKYEQVENTEENSTILQMPSTSATRDKERERRAKLATERKAKILQQMQTMQQNFLEQNCSYFEETKNKTERMEAHYIENNVYQPIALGPNQTEKVHENTYEICILCQDEDQIHPNGPAMVLAAVVQQTALLCQNTAKKDLMDTSQHDDLFLRSNLGPALHVNTCGHVMHTECWKKYIDVLRVKHRRSDTPRSNLDVEKDEMLCPLCQSFSNIVLPIMPSLTIVPNNLNIKSNFDDWLQNMRLILSKKDKCRKAYCVNCVILNKIKGDGTMDVEYNFDCIQRSHELFFCHELPSDLSELFMKIFPQESVLIDDSIQAAVTYFVKNLYLKGFKNSSVVNERLIPTAWKSLAFTIHSTEILLRDSDKPLLGNLSSKQRDSLKHFIKTVSHLGSTLKNNLFMNDQAMMLLSSIFINDNKGPSILQWDSFGFLVSLTFSLPSLLLNYSAVPLLAQGIPVSTGNTLDWHILRLSFICHIVKVIIILKKQSNEFMKTATNINLDFLEIICDENQINLWKQIQYNCLPFLKCCVLFYHHLSETLAPKVLTEIGGATFENMCSYLDLPHNPKDIFDSTEIKQLIKLWINHQNVSKYLESTNPQLHYDPQFLPRLVELPADYSELMNIASTFVCPNRGRVLANPYLCLVCGNIFCFCTSDNHATILTVNIPILLQLKKSQVLFLSTSKFGYSDAAPYIDDHGETDQGLLRSNRLKFCIESYKKLQNLWISHSIYQDIAKYGSSVSVQCPYHLSKP